MNWLPFIVGVGGCFFIAGFCEDEEKPRIKVFFKGFCLSFSFLLLGAVALYKAEIGYFSGKELTTILAIKSLFVCILMAVTVGLKSAFPNIN